MHKKAYQRGILSGYSRDFALPGAPILSEGKDPRHAKPYPKQQPAPHAAKDAKDVERMRLEHDLITDSGIVPATKGRHAIYSPDGDRHH